MPGTTLPATFATASDFLRAFDAEISKGGLLIRDGAMTNASAMADCTVELRVESEPPLQLSARVAAVVPNVGVAVMFSGVDFDALTSLVAKLKSPAPEAPPEAESAEAEEAGPAGSASEKLKAMSVSQKMQLALTADRQTRFFLLRDTNKALHLYVLKNPRIGLDEVQAAAKMPTCSMEALKFISESADWGKNGVVCAALAKNPATPLPLAIKVLPRVPMQELKALAKGGARQPIVQAARKLMNG